MRLAVETSVLSQQQTSASAFITQHQLSPHRPCVGPEQCSCSERSERAERSEHVWPQIVRNIWPTLANNHSKLTKIHSKVVKMTKVDMLRFGDVSFDFGFEW